MWNHAYDFPKNFLPNLETFWEVSSWLPPLVGASQRETWGRGEVGSGPKQHHKASLFIKWGKYLADKENNCRIISSAPKYIFSEFINNAVYPLYILCNILIYFTTYIIGNVENLFKVMDLTGTFSKFTV